MLTLCFRGKGKVPGDKKGGDEGASVDWNA